MKEKIKNILAFLFVLVSFGILVFYAITRTEEFDQRQTTKPCTRSIETITLGIAYHDFLGMPQAEFYAKFYVEAQQKYKINWKRFAAITRVESAFDQHAISSAGARGLMQLVPSTAKYVAGLMGDTYHEGDEFIDTLNLRWGCYYLSKCRMDFGDKKFVGAYLMGSSKTNGETKTYDSLVTVEYRKLTSIEDGLEFVEGVQ